MTILEYIQSVAGDPVREIKGSFWFFSPFRKESDASFQYTPSMGDFGKFHDWGSGQHGSGLDFVCLWENCDHKEAYAILRSKTATKKVVAIKKENSCVCHNIIVEEFSKYRLFEYAHKRAVNRQILTKYCKQIIEDDKFFYIGMLNEAGGYAVRNKDFKAFKGNASFSFFKAKDFSSVLVFEGMFDMLSYVSYAQNLLSDRSIIVLNSTSMVDKALPTIGKFKEIHLYLDNDESGDKATRDIKHLYVHAIDHRDAYKEFNDVNDYIISLKA